MVDTLEIIPTVKLRKKPQYHEFALQRTIWEYLSWRGVFCWIDYQPMTPKGKRSFQHHSSVGVSDILGSYQGRPLAIEVKVGTNKPTPKQLEFLERAKMAGWIAFVARSIEDVQRELKFKEV